MMKIRDKKTKSLFAKCYNYIGRKQNCIDWKPISIVTKAVKTVNIQRKYSKYSIAYSFLYTIVS